MDIEKTNAFVDKHFDEKFTAPLSKFVEIPNLSPSFDDTYFTNGLNEKAIEFVSQYAKSLEIEGLTEHVYKEEGKAPLILYIYEGEAKKNVMLYGHLDKQPHMDGWKEGTGPITPAIIDGKLYGRGSSDDGFVPFMVLLAIKNAIDQGQKLPRIVLCLETEEESGSPSLVYLLKKQKEIIEDRKMKKTYESKAKRDTYKRN